MISSVEDTQRLKFWQYTFTLPLAGQKRSSKASTMENLTESDCSLAPANEPAAMPSLPSGTKSEITRYRVAVRRTIRRNAALGSLAACILACCGDAPPA